MRYLSLALFLVACGGEAPPPPAPAPAAPPPAAAPTPPPPPAEAAAPARLNLNSATAAQLGAIPGMTPKMVHEFEEYRPYVSIAQFRKEMGKYVDAPQVAAWEPYVYVPIDINGADAATLQQIEGLTEAGAQALIAGRPYANAEAFATALGAQVSPDQAAKAKPLLSAP